MISASGYSRETSEGYEKATTVGGHPAVEKWNAEQQDGELTAVVADRFMVEIDGRNRERRQDTARLCREDRFGKIAAMK